MLSDPVLPSELVESMYEFGRHLGMAFQLIDDVLDFVAEEASLGKPGHGADVQLGIATGPVLFAAQRVSFPMFNYMKIQSVFWDSCGFLSSDKCLPTGYRLVYVL